MLEPALAEIVAAPFHQHGSKFIGINRLDKRYVLLDELFLQGDRMGRDDHAFFLPHGKIDRGQKIGKRFADSGAGFHQQMMLVRQRLLDGLGHFQLLGTKFISLPEPGAMAPSGERMESSAAGISTS